MLRLPETLHPEYRLTLNRSHIGGAVRLVLLNRASLFYTFAMSVMFGGIMAYVGMVQQIFGEVFDTDRYYSHSWGADLAETGRRMARYFSAFEHIELLSDDFVAEDDFVTRRATSRVRHVGEVFGVAATNRILTVHTVEIWRLANGKIIEHWGGLGEAWHLYEQITANE